ncbi:hypothetical protein [Mycobacterium sp. E2327]|uniref:hypothetical protein n=1 Tax=Mycobacterium sp. E2327 TaxID=1834132 RepID=UPI000AAF16BF|nr:hypothetical protein [Mycobacterium sp. E2327]
MSSNDYANEASNEPEEIIDAEVVESDSLPDSDPSRVTALQTWRPPQYSEEWWAWVSPELAANRCRAHSSRDGHRCRRPAIAGATVCRAHGGAAKHVKAAARARLENAAEKAVRQLITLAITADSEQVQLGASNSIVDRTLGKPVQAIAVGTGEAAPWEEIMYEGISTATREESRAARGLPADSPAQGDGAYPGQPQPRTTRAGTYASRADCQASEGYPPNPQGKGTWGEAGDNVEGCSPSGGQGGTGGTGSDRQGRHVTGEAALELAWRLAETRGLPSPHKRYLRP